MSNEYEKGGLPAASGVHLPSVPANHSAAGFTLNFAGVPIPLRRTFGAIDRLLAIPIEALGDALEKKIKGNLDAHVETVQKKRKKRGKKEKIDDPSLRVTRAMADWAINAADVEPSDKDMSALWEAVLDALMDDEDEGEQLLKIVKEANRSDIRFFLQRYGEGGGLTFGTEPARMERLKYIGLVDPVWGANFLILLGAMFAVVLYFLDRYAPKVIIGASPLTDFSLTWIGLSNLVVPMGATAAIILFFMHQVKRPTPLGRRLLELYHGYKGDEK